MIQFSHSLLSTVAVTSLALSVGCSLGQAGESGSNQLDTNDSAAMSALTAPTVTQCHGTEPFWGLTISADKIFLEDNSDLGHSFSMKNTGAKSAVGRQLDYMALYQGRTLEDSSRFMNVIIENEKCSDGMSDNEYGFSVHILTGSTLFSGCCSR